MNSLKVVIADDNEKMVDVIKEVINDEPDMEVVGTAANGEEKININRQITHVIQKQAPQYL